MASPATATSPRTTGTIQADLAIDLGGTKTSFAVIDSTGAVLAPSRRPSHAGCAVVGFDALAASATDTSGVAPGHNMRVFETYARRLAERGAL